MAFPKSRILSAKSLSQMIKESTENRDQRFCFILGSGASVESGIPSGSTFEMQWMDCLMGKSEDDAEETRRLASYLYEEKEIEHKFDEIETAWREAKEKRGAISSEYYFDIYKLRFHANPREGYSYLEKIMERCTPSPGYHTLAKLLTENDRNNLVITTNFDNLVEDALFLYTDKKPLVVSHESLVDYMDANTQRPIVAKVHRGLMYAPFNSPETTKELKTEWKAALNYALKTYTPIVIGYAGGDHSLMSFLEKDCTGMRKGVYWCYRGKPDPSELPEEKIQRCVRNWKGYFVAIDGFDALMVEIGKAMYGDAIRPSLTADHLEKSCANRVQRYIQQWEKLNEKPEIQEVLQEMNEAERHEEEQREKEQTLTVWDYIRRGNRAYDEGRQQDAMNEYSNAIRLDSNYAVAYNNRGIVYADLRQHEKAMKDYDKAIELDSNYAFAYNNRGIVHADLGEYEKAIKDYDKAIELNPNYAEAHNNRGIVYDDLGQHEKAIKDYDKAIELNPNYAEAHNNRGIVYDNLGQHEKAIKDYDKAIELNPNYAEAHNNRGIVYDNLGQHEKAIEDYTQAIQLNTKYKNAYLNRARVYSTIGEEVLAEADRKKAEEL